MELVVIASPSFSSISVLPLPPVLYPQFCKGHFENEERSLCSVSKAHPIGQPSIGRRARPEGTASGSGVLARAGRHEVHAYAAIR